MNAIPRLVFAVAVAVLSAAAVAQGDLRAPLAQPLKIKQGMLNVPAL